jgi:hypothetical protein
VVRFAVTPAPTKGFSSERFAAQLALSRVHPCLVALERTVVGYAPPREATSGWFDLSPKRGLAGYGLSRALRMLLDVLAAVTALEDTRTVAGEPFVHGELVPAMLRVDRSGTTRLIPLAPWHWSEPGTPPASERCGHLAPERLLGDAVDARADVFSAGALLWEALAGRRLFENDSVETIVTRLMADKVTLPQLPPELSWAIPLKGIAARALAVDPEQRFANCAEFADAIEAVVGDRVATHADVANYFDAPERGARPSVSAGPLRLPKHHSSLSALVAPTQPEPAELEPARPGQPDPVAVERRASRSVWAIAAISCLLGALGVSAVARHRGSLPMKPNATQGAPLLGASLPATAPIAVAPTASAQPMPTDVPLSTVAAVSMPALIATPLAPAAASSANRTLPHKSQKGANAEKGLAPNHRSPAKALRSPAAKYGI